MKILYASDNRPTSKNNLDGFTNLDEAVGQLLPKFKKLEERMKLLEEQKVTE